MQSMLRTERIAADHCIKYKVPLLAEQMRRNAFRRLAKGRDGYVEVLLDTTMSEASNQSPEEFDRAVHEAFGGLHWDVTLVKSEFGRYATRLIIEFKQV